ncbi:MAG: hypothetical protein Q7S66_06045 [bacterium]|nr:hypothetical protein [bacterium]
MPDELISKRPYPQRTQFAPPAGAPLFSVAIILFLIFLLVWGGLYFYKRSLDANAENWRSQISSLENELRPDLLNQLIGLSNRLAATREILSRHTFSSNTLALLERDTHPQVSFTSFQYSEEGRKIELSAKAASYRVVADQVMAFEADPQVESVGFGGLQLDDKGLVGFKLSIIFKPSLTKLRPQ